MTTTVRDPNHVLSQLTRAGNLAGSIFSRGVIDLIRDPKAAADYWRRIANAAVYPAKNASERLLCLPRREIDQIIPGAESIPVTLVDYQFANGDMPIHELMVLCKIVRYRQPKVIFEIGTFLGGTTLQLAANSHAQVYTMDLPPPGQKDHVPPQIWDPESDVYPDKPGVRFQGTSYADRIQQLLGDTQTFDFTPYYGKVDLVFVDGCHHYEFVLRDSKNALKMMSPNGIVVWHDYGPNYASGVVRVLNELGQSLPLIHLSGTSIIIYNREAHARKC